MILMVAALWMGGNPLKAQSAFGVEYYGELQSDFKGGVNFPNLLRLNLDIPLGRFLTVEASSISIAKTSEERLVDDLQTFSNIEEDNLPFALARLGLAIRPAEDHTIYIGIRNVNEDYFTSPVTSLFTNSSCGIYPTLSCNFPIANYPLAAMCLHYTFESEHWQALASAYTGFFLLSQGAYKRGGSYYCLGGCLYTKGPSGTLWTYAEQHIVAGLSLIAGYSHAFGPLVPCTDFFGLGAHYAFPKVELGLFTDYARFRDNFEWATELTCAWRLSNHISLQPALHAIFQRDIKAAVGLLRLIITI